MFDWRSLIVGVLLGWLVGYLLNRLVAWSRRVRVVFNQVELSKSSVGELYKVVFTLKGNESPGICSCEIVVGDKVRFAKWDEAPNPLLDDKLSKFVPEKVPQTFHQNLYVNKVYRLPIIVCENRKYYVFDGWWFGRNKGYYEMTSLSGEDPIKIVIRGEKFYWEKIICLNKVVSACR